MIHERARISLHQTRYTLDAEPLLPRMTRVGRSGARVDEGLDELELHCLSKTVLELHESNEGIGQKGRGTFRFRPLKKGAQNEGRGR
jgi:hypothetical protein